MQLRYGAATRIQTQVKLVGGKCPYQCATFSFLSNFVAIIPAYSN